MLHFQVSPSAPAEQAVPTGRCGLRSAAVVCASGNDPLPGASTTAGGELCRQMVAALVAGRHGRAIRDGGEPAAVGVHLADQGVADPAVAGLAVGVGGAAVGLPVGPLDGPEGEQASAVPVGALAVEAFGVPNRCADREPQRAAAGDDDLSELAAGQPEQVVGVVGGASGGGDKALVAAVTIGVDRSAGDQPVGTDPVPCVV